MYINYIAEWKLIGHSMRLILTQLLTKLINLLHAPPWILTNWLYLDKYNIFFTCCHLITLSKRERSIKMWKLIFFDHKSYFFNVRLSWFKKNISLINSKIFVLDFVLIARETVENIANKCTFIESTIYFISFILISPCFISHLIISSHINTCIDYHGWFYFSWCSPFLLPILISLTLCTSSLHVLFYICLSLLHRPRCIGIIIICITHLLIEIIHFYSSRDDMANISSQFYYSLKKNCATIMNWLITTQIFN